jgi:LmbE family N-acetylglucosaminyl deacetylase
MRKPLSNAERQRRFRKALKRSGQTMVRVPAHPDDVAAIQRYAERKAAARVSR